MTAQLGREAQEVGDEEQPTQQIKSNQEKSISNFLLANILTNTVESQVEIWIITPFCIPRKLIMFLLSGLSRDRKCPTDSSVTALMPQ